MPFSLLRLFITKCALKLAPSCLDVFKIVAFTIFVYFFLFYFIFLSLCLALSFLVTSIFFSLTTFVSRPHINTDLLHWFHWLCRFAWLLLLFFWFALTCLLCSFLLGFFAVYFRCFLAIIATATDTCLLLFLFCLLDYCCYYQWQTEVLVATCHEALGKWNLFH